MEKLYELLQDMPFYKKGEQRTAKEWCNVMQVPNVFIFDQKMKAGQLTEWFKEVEQRIDLILSERKWNSRNFIQRFDGNLTQEHLEICEAALNAPKEIQDALVDGKEFICLDGFDTADFWEWQHKKSKVNIPKEGLMNAIKEYLKQK